MSLTLNAPLFHTDTFSREQTLISLRLHSPCLKDSMMKTRLESAVKGGTFLIRCIFRRKEPQVDLWETFTGEMKC